MEPGRSPSLEITCRAQRSPSRWSAARASSKTASRSKKYACRSRVRPDSDIGTPDFRNGAPQPLRPGRSAGVREGSWQCNRLAASTMRTCAAPPELPSLPVLASSAFRSACPLLLQARPCASVQTTSLENLATYTNPPLTKDAVAEPPGPRRRVAHERYSRYRIRAHPRHARRRLKFRLCYVRPDSNSYPVRDF